MRTYLKTALLLSVVSFFILVGCGSSPVETGPYNGSGSLEVDVPTPDLPTQPKTLSATYTPAVSQPSFSGGHSGTGSTGSSTNSSGSCYVQVFNASGKNITDDMKSTGFNIPAARYDSAHEICTFDNTGHFSLILQYADHVDVRYEVVTPPEIETRASDSMTRQAEPPVQEQPVQPIPAGTFTFSQSGSLITANWSGHDVCFAQNTADSSTTGFVNGGSVNLSTGNYIMWCASSGKSTNVGSISIP